jgi:outer membrane protein OmpA-like peptidoglycan-associated protein
MFLNSKIGLAMITVATSVAVLLVACVTPGGSGSSSGGQSSMSRAQQGALIGAATGAVAGALLKKKKRGKGALIGAALGAAGGAVIGNYMDKQAEELRQVADVVRSEDGIVVTMRDRILFDTNKADVKPASQQSLNKLADILKKYEKTEITIAGHTDGTGARSYNQQLSERRADSVRLYLSQRGVAPSRMTAMGFGEDRPITSNASPDGQAANRRVELHISPDERLLDDARRAG